MKKLIFFQLPPPSKSQCSKLKFTLPNFPNILLNKPIRIFSLLILIMSMFLFSCEDQPVIRKATKLLNKKITVYLK